MCAAGSEWLAEKISNACSLPLKTTLPSALVIRMRCRLFSWRFSTASFWMMAVSDMTISLAQYAQ
jgi:hypothetical protein